MEYIAYLHKDHKSDYGVSFPDFPGCITAGASLDEARRMATEALSFHIAGLREDNAQIPEPSTLDDLRKDPAMKDAVAFLVEVQEPEKTVRFNITARKTNLPRLTTARGRPGSVARPTLCVVRLGIKTCAVHHRLRRSGGSERSHNPGASGYFAVGRHGTQIVHRIGLERIYAR